MSAPYHCFGKIQQCVSNKAACDAQIDQGCDEDCERFVAATPQIVTLSKDASTAVDISISSTTGIRTTVHFPVGAISAANEHVRFAPASYFSLPSDQLDKIVSSPFSCYGYDGSVRNLTLTHAATVESAVDRIMYSASAATTNENHLPCDLQSNYQLFLRANGGAQQCPGLASVSDEEITLSVTQCSDATNFSLSVTGITTQALWDPLVQVSNYTIKATDVNKKPRCILAGRTNNVITLAFTTEASDACPTWTEVANVKQDLSVFTLLPTFETEDVCITDSHARDVADEDICLGRMGSDGTAFECFETRKDRINLDWTSIDGQRVRGRLTECNPDVTYAFINSPIPPPPPPLIVDIDWWTEYGDTFMGVLFFLLLFFLAVGFALWRMYRYRIKYKEEKEHLDGLYDRAAELDEFAGGLGIADTDGDLDMVANPLVIEMQALENRAKKIAKDLEAKEGADAETIDTLESQRQKIYAEIARVKAEMQKNQVSRAPTRMDTAPVAARPGPGGTATTGRASAVPGRAAPPGGALGAAAGGAKKKEKKGFGAGKKKKKNLD